MKKCFLILLRKCLLWIHATGDLKNLCNYTTVCLPDVENRLLFILFTVRKENNAQYFIYILFLLNVIIVDQNEIFIPQPTIQFYYRQIDKL